MGSKLAAQDYLLIVDSLETLLERETNPDIRLGLISACLENTVYNDLDTAYHYVRWFENEARQSEDPKEIARAKNFYGLHAYISGDYFNSVFLFEDALEAYRALEDTFMIGMCLNNIGGSYEFQDDRENSERYVREASEYFALAENQQWEFYAKFNLIGHLLAQYKFQEAEPMLEESVAYFKSNGEFANLGEAYISLARVRFALYGPQQGLEVLMKVDPEQNIIEKGAEIRFNVIQCQIYTALQRYGEAQPKCELGTKLADEYGVLEKRRDAYDASYSYYRSIGDFKRASDNQIILTQLSDSLVVEMKDREIQSILTKQRMRDKEKELLLKDIALDKSQQESRFFKIMAGLIGIILLGAAVFTWSRIRTNRQLREQKRIIEKSLGEKELLIREIHHRVKNNLQLVTSLLRLQSRGIKDKAALDAVNESQSRVRSMALIHRDLYQFDNLRAVNARQYVSQLTDSLFHSFDVEDDRIALVNDVEEILIDVDTIVPLGLIINELITNSLKYAFPDERSGKISIDLREQNEELWLRICDDGIGLSSEEKETDSFGLDMVKAFSDSLKATWNINGDEGTVVEMRIRNYRLAS